MATRSTFPLMDLPPELRLRVYDFCDLVHRQPLSIFSIVEVPDVIHKVTLSKELSEEMFDTYFSKNRFSINCLMGLPQLFDAAGEARISKIRHLRLIMGERRAKAGLFDWRRIPDWVRTRMGRGRLNPHRHNAESCPA